MRPIFSTSSWKQENTVTMGHFKHIDKHNQPLQTFLKLQFFWRVIASCLDGTFYPMVFVVYKSLFFLNSIVDLLYFLMYTSMCNKSCQKTPGGNHH